MSLRPLVCLGLRVRIQQSASISVSCNCCVFLFRGLCVGLISFPEESYRVWSRRSLIRGYDPIKGRNNLWGWWELMHCFVTEIIVDLTLDPDVRRDPFHWHLSRVIIKNYPFLLWHHIRSRIYRNVNSNSLYLGNAMDMYSLGAVQTPDIQNVFIPSVISAEKFQHSATVRPRRSHWTFFHSLSLSLGQMTNAL